MGSPWSVPVAFVLPSKSVRVLGVASFVSAYPSPLSASFPNGLRVDYGFCRGVDRAYPGSRFDLRDANRSDDRDH